jgi:hypothetical protein
VPFLINAVNSAFIASLQCGLLDANVKQVGSTSKGPMPVEKALGGGLGMKSVGKDLGLWMAFWDLVRMGWRGAGGREGLGVGSSEGESVEGVGEVQEAFEGHGAVEEEDTWIEAGRELDDIGVSGIEEDEGPWKGNKVSLKTTLHEI